jgi:hypothetical protein
MVTFADAPLAEAALSSPTDDLIDRVTVRHQEALETMEAAGEALFDGMARTQREIAEFVAERLRQDMAARQALLGCRTFQDLRDVQSRFLRTAVDQYAEETARLMRLGGDVLARSMDRGAT